MSELRTGGLLPRLDAPELEDQAWFPTCLRDAMTGYLQVVIELAGPYDVAGPTISELLESTSSTSVLDLASGAGGPWVGLMEALKVRHPDLRVALTDRSPNLSVAARVRAVEGLTYVPEPVSAEAPPPGAARVRTMFTALHHFDPDSVRAILAAAQRDRVGFAAFEATQRSLRGVLVTLFIPILVLFLMPRVVPRRVLPLILTYVPPLLPLLIWWDGFASTLRTYTVEELRAMVAEIEEPGYSWRVEEIEVRGAPIPVLQVVGRPKE